MKKITFLNINDITKYIWIYVYTDKIFHILCIYLILDLSCLRPLDLCAHNFVYVGKYVIKFSREKQIHQWCFKGSFAYANCIIVPPPPRTTPQQLELNKFDYSHIQTRIDWYSNWPPWLWLTSIFVYCISICSNTWFTS